MIYFIEKKYMTTQVLILIGFVIIVFIIQCILFVNQYKRGSLDKALIVYGKLSPKDLEPYKILTSGAVFVFPVLQNFYFLDLDIYKCDLDFKVMDKNERSILFETSIVVRPDTKRLNIIVDNFFNKDKHFINEYLVNTIQRKVKDIVKSKRMELEKDDLIIEEIEIVITKFIFDNGFRLVDEMNVFYKLQ